MALRDLLVYLDQTDRALVRLRLAVDLARRHGSWLTALYAREWNPGQLAHRKTAELAGQPLGEMARLDHDVEASIDDSADRLRSELERLAAHYGLRTEWRNANGEPSVALPQHARYADLCVLDVDTPAGSTSAGYRFSEEMLFTAGRPVLFVPAGDFQTLGRHIVIAWNSSRASARAINDALPLLERAEATTVLAINPADFIGRHGALPLTRLIEHLARHGIAAQSVQVTDAPPAGIADELQARARALGADLIVAGAYGHTWLREVLLGSVTRDLLARMQLPTMMSY